MARGSGRWENRDLRHTFPLASERKAEPRFDGRYGDDEAGEIRFASDGTLLWNGQSGEWLVHGGVLRVRAPEHDCEGAIDAGAVYLLCAAGRGRDARRQFVLAFTPDA
jgi:hypothetical protein